MLSRLRKCKVIIGICKAFFGVWGLSCRQLKTKLNSAMKKLLLTTWGVATSIGALNAQTHDYALAQKLSTRFLGAQRCGNTGSWMHGACHTQDGAAVGKDLSGGWHDCGDYIKFHHTGPYAAVMYLTAYEAFPAAYADDYSPANSAGSPNGIPDILDEVKIETDYLIKGVQNGTVYWQVGGAEDHDSFSEPVSCSSEKLYSGSATRPVFSTTSGYSNACGNAAAALALMSIVYKPYDDAYATQCLQKAIEYYNVGKISPASSNANPIDFYSFSDYKDEMGLAAAVIYRAGNKATGSYLTEAQSYAIGFNTGDPLYYGNVSYLGYLELYRLTSGSTATGYLNKVAAEVTKVKNAMGSCGYYHYDNWGSLVYAANEAMLAALYHQISNDATAYAFAKNNINFILGTHSAVPASDAPANFSFVIGYNKLGGGSPKSPQHAASFGYTTAQDPWTKFTNETNNPGSVTFKYPLNGALVGGLQKKCTLWSASTGKANYEDKIDNYVGNEVCTYYNAGLTGALAYINMIENSIPTANADVKVHTALNVYPNPANDQIVINSTVQGQFTIIDYMGKAVESFYLNGSKLVDLSAYPSGFYFIVNIDATVVQKFVIE